MWKEIVKFEKCIVTYRNHIKSLQDGNKRIVDKLNQLKNVLWILVNVKHEILKIYNWRFTWNIKYVH